MSTLEWFSLAQLEIVQALPIAKCAGTVKHIQRKSTYFSFAITDGNHEVQATIYEDQKQYSCLDLPKINDNVVVVGNVYRKQTLNKNFITKAKVKLYRVISQDELSKISSRIIQNQRSREQRDHIQTVTTKTKRSILNELKSTILPVQIRSLIMGCVYMTLENNLDLNSYTFSWYSIQKHRLTKSYLESKKLKEESVQYLQQFIDSELKYLAENKQIEEKQKIDGQMLYVVYRAIFTRFEMRILGIINEKQKTGTVLNELVHILNKQQGFVEERNYIINENFVQKILKKFIDQSRIYKTSDKILYPNS